MLNYQILRKKEGRKGGFIVCYGLVFTLDHCLSDCPRHFALWGAPEKVTCWEHLSSFPFCESIPFSQFVHLHLHMAYVAFLHPNECRDERSKAISVNLSTLDVTGPASSHYTRCNCSFVPVRREMFVNGMEYELSLLSERRSRVFYPHIPSGLVSMRRRLSSLCVEMDTQEWISFHLQNQLDLLGYGSKSETFWKAAPIDVQWWLYHLSLLKRVGYNMSRHWAQL